METWKNRNFFARLIFIVTIMLTLSGTAFPTLADDAADARQLVEKSRITFESFIAAGEMEAFRSLLADARGIFIAPQVLKGAFVFGASGGTGAFLAKDEKTGRWEGPAFYTIGGVSFGFQIGGQSSEVILVALTDRGVTAFLGSSVKLGADVGIAAGPIGMGAAASSANFSADIVSFASSKGLFGGISLDGALVKIRDGLNEDYYSRKDISPADILVRHTASNPQARPLIEAVAKAAAKK